MSQATVSRWLNGESIPHPLARQALSKQFDKLDSYWFGGKTDQEIQTDTEGGALQLQERPYESPQRGPTAGGQRLPDYTRRRARSTRRIRLGPNRNDRRHVAVKVARGLRTSPRESDCPRPGVTQTSKSGS